MSTNRNGDEKANSEWKEEFRYYENLQQQSLLNMPPVLHYKVVRAILKNMQEQGGAETLFIPTGDNAESILEARSKAMAFADNLLLELHEAREKGLAHFDTVPESVNEIISLKDKTILSVHVNVVYRDPFTEIDLLKYDVSQSTEDVIYHTDEAYVDFEIVSTALNREAHSIKANHAGDVVALQLPNLGHLLLLRSDYGRYVQKAFISVITE
jgi:hypothetical protein